MDVLQCSVVFAMKRYVFDIETEKTADEVGGWKNKHCMGIAVLCAEDYDTGETFVFSDSYNGAVSLDQLRDTFDGSILIGHNIKCFDVILLQHEVAKRGGSPVLNIGILDTGTKRIGLGAMAGATLGTYKLMDGAMAPLEWRRGDEARRKVVEYCADDVKKSKELLMFGVKNGYVNYTDKEGIRRRLNVDWKEKLENMKPQEQWPECIGKYCDAKEQWQCSRCAFKHLCKEKKGVE